MRIDPKYIGLFFADLDDYIKALIKSEQSDHVEDSVRLSELRQDFIDKIIGDGYHD